MSDKVLNQLLTECADWYGDFVKNNARVPKSVSGVSADGKRFVFLLDVLDDMKFDHVQRHKFIKVVLEQEKTEAYIYGTRVMAFPDKSTNPEEMLDIVAANSRRFICGSWRVIRGTDGCAKEIQHVSTHEGQDPEEYPGAWFLTSALSVSRVERRKINDLWSQLRKNAQFNFAPTSPIKSEESPREILAADFESLHGGLPIRGGWGYTQADACIIVKNDPLVDESLPFDGVSVEYVFVEKRIYEEMIILPPDGGKFSGIEWNLQEQSHIQDAERHFDKLVFEITAFRDSDWEDLKTEFEGSQGHGHPDFDEEAHERKRQEKTVRFTREFWFDITSFYGQGLVLTDKLTGNKTLLPTNSFKFTDKFKKLFGID